MVVLGSHDGKPGRYWGDGEGPSASPSQASKILARINSRARERKAGTLQGKGGVKGRKGDAWNVTHKHATLIQEDGKEGRETTGDTEGRVNGLKTREEDAERKGKREDEREGVREDYEEVKENERQSSLERQEGSPVKKKKKRRNDEEQVKEEEKKCVLDPLEVVVKERERLSSLGGQAASPKKRDKEPLEEEQEQQQEADSVKKKKKRHEGENIDVEGEESETKKKKRDKQERINGEGTDELSSETSEYKRKKKGRKEKGENNQEGVLTEENEETPSLNTTQEINLEPRQKKKRKERGENEIVTDEGNKDEPFVDTTREENDVTLSSPRKKKKRKEKGEENEENQLLNTTQEHEINLTSPGKKKRKMKVETEEGDEEKRSESEQSSKVTNVMDKENMKVEFQDMEVDEDENESQEVKVNEESVKEDKKKRKNKKDKLKKKNKNKNKKEVGGFTLLTEVEATRRQKVQRTLPHWLANPTVIGRDLMTDGTPADTLSGLDSSLVDLLKKSKINRLFPVQRALIPEILAGSGPLACRFRPRDVCVSAPTGSGKTLAYVLPLIQALKTRIVPRIRALVLLPVQELANQVYHVFLSYCKGTSLHVGRAIGHTTMQKEQSTLVIPHLDTHHSLVDILVATPGRLADHIRTTPGLDLSAVRYLVLDEADRMLAAEGGDWVAHVQRTIADHQTKHHHHRGKYQPPMQRLLFSATLSSDPEQLQHVTLHHPKLFTVAPPSAGQDKTVAVVMGQYVRPAELKEEFVLVEEEVKPLALHHLLVSGEGRKRVLVFTNSVHATHKLALLLATLSEGTGRVVAEFSSKRDKRQQILSQFAAGKIDVLVSSDAMARGLDVPDIDHVVSYDVTATATYVHRIGRTARAGRPGTALSIVTKSTLTEFRRALSGGGEGASQLTLTSEELEPYEQQYIDALAHMKEMLEEEERQKRLNNSSGKGKKKKKNQRQKVRKQKKDKRTANRIAKRKAEGNTHPTFNANRLRNHTRQ